MNWIFEEIRRKGFVVIYLDDILIFALTKEGLRLATIEVLEKLAEHDLYCKPEKCEFEKEKIGFLGMVIEQGRISMDTAKLEGIRAWPQPGNVHEVRQFLGFGNYY